MCTLLCEPSSFPATYPKHQPLTLFLKVLLQCNWISVQLKLKSPSSPSRHSPTCLPPGTHDPEPHHTPAHDFTHVSVLQVVQPRPQQDIALHAIAACISHVLDGGGQRARQPQIPQPCCLGLAEEGTDPAALAWQRRAQRRRDLSVFGLDRVINRQKENSVPQPCHLGLAREGTESAGALSVCPAALAWQRTAQGKQEVVLYGNNRDNQQTIPCLVNLHRRHDWILTSQQRSTESSVPPDSSTNKA
eukprot:560139-Pelagomonas_calceolata.AAC.3